jgi:putative colanic acid biosysnthesis UDP-glucose lipid carrier transferase
MRINISILKNNNVIKSALHIYDSMIIIGYMMVLMNYYDVPYSIHYAEIMLFAVVISAGLFSYFQLYRSWRSDVLVKEFLLTVKCWSAVVGALLFIVFALDIESYLSRPVVLCWFISTPLIIFLSHSIVRLSLRNVRISGINNKRCVIVGTGNLGRSVARCIQNTPWAGIKIAGYFGECAPESNDGKGLHLLGGYQDLPQFLARNKIDHVYIALPIHRQKLIMTILSSCRMLGSELFVVPDLFSFHLINSEIRTLGDIIVLNFNPQLGTKRLLDIFFALLALIIFSPLWAIISLLIKIEDGGPIFYRQDRIREAGRTFKCLKFRTMHVDASEQLAELLKRNSQARQEWANAYKLKNDPRITKIGHFLRKTSLDELPQFLNVLWGEMSIVGARPVVKDELMKYYKNNIDLYCSAKPGITGPWQVGKRSDIKDYDERVQLDSEYILNWSIWTDLKIIGKTCMTIFTGRGAY